MQKTAVIVDACDGLDQLTWTARRTFVQALDLVTGPHCVRRGQIYGYSSPGPYALTSSMQCPP